MHEVHPSFSAPEPQRLIWRYMDVPKFLSLLDSQALFFASASIMDDPYEGATTRATTEMMRHSFGSVHAMPNEFFKQLDSSRRQIRKAIYLNCWHMSEHESAAMWALYQGGGSGVAIQSTYEQLRDSLQTEHSVYIGTVEYKDYEVEVIDPGNDFNFYVTKRKSFEYEHELRAVTSAGVDFLSDNVPTGVLIPVDLDTLVAKVFVAPRAAPWLTNLIQSLVHKYERSWDVQQSSLYSGEMM